MAAASRKDTRQPNTTIIREKAMGEIAAPTAEPAMMKACTAPCDVMGIQLAAIRPVDG